MRRVILGAKIREGNGFTTVHITLGSFEFGRGFFDFSDLVLRSDIFKSRFGVTVCEFFDNFCERYLYHELTPGFAFYYVSRDRVF